MSNCKVIALTNQKGGVGMTLGGLMGVMLMCCLQINRLSDREVKKSEKPKGTDTFPFD